MITCFCYYLKTVEQVDEGAIRVKVSFGTIQISDKTYDLCHNLPAVNLSCPLQPGNCTKHIIIVYCVIFRSFKVYAYHTYSSNSSTSKFTIPNHMVVCHVAKRAGVTHLEKRKCNFHAYIAPCSFLNLNHYVCTTNSCHLLHSTSQFWLSIMK